jgi:hypothetical protein
LNVTSIILQPRSTLTAAINNRSTLIARFLPQFPLNAVGAGLVRVTLISGVLEIRVNLADIIAGLGAGTFQPIDQDLTAIAALTGTGIAVRTAADTWALRTLTAPAAGITVTNPAGIAGNPTLVLANDLAALEALTGTGIAKRTGIDTWSIVGTLTVPDGGTGAVTLTDRGVLFGRGTSPIEASSAGTAGQVLKSGGAGANGAYADDLVTITAVIDGGGVTITTGIKGDLEIPFACTILQATLLADQSGSIVVNVWKDTFANYPPTVGDKITASAPPTITTSTKSQDSTLTGWTTAIAAGDTLRFNVDSVTTIQRVTLSLKARRL